MSKSMILLVFALLVGMPHHNCRGAEPFDFQRSFRMGFTGFPHDITLPAVTEARTFCRTHGDIIAHHMEGVPWTECLTKQPLSEKLRREWKGKKEATAAGGHVYVAISPGRGDLKVADHCLPIDEKLKGKSYDDPRVIEAYLEYCRRAVAFFEPDYLAIGIEVNDIYKNAGPDVWKAYAALHEHVYKALKEDHPDLPIFASLTLHNLLNAEETKREKYVEAYRQILPFCDLIAVSYYPFIQGGTTEIKPAFEWLTSTFDEEGKPYAFVETGEAAEQLKLGAFGVTIRGTTDKQYAYLIELLYFAQTQDTEFVIWFIHRDYDAMWEKIKAHVPEAHGAWRDSGLMDENGDERPAMLAWEKYFETEREAD
ncbi:MAG: hypothetical protein ACR2NU_14355 [Aeoliella sp.]